MSKQAPVTLHIANARLIDIQFKDLSYEVKLGYRGPKKQILKGLNGLFKSGELTAIMGPSGAGKSTLLNVLSGLQQGQMTGTIEYLNSSGKQNWNKCKKESCYIQQTDFLYGCFTVHESMMIAAYLKIDNMTKKLRQILIDNILNTLNLSKIKDTKANRLSGGQKKRLSIALELIDNPSIMFLDEPTTGLDSLSSLQCITALQTLAKNGRTVICTIHQPSAMLYQMFDYVYLVVDGQCMYANTPVNTVSYFAQQNFQCPTYHNPADYMLEVVNREYGNYDDQLITVAKQYCRRDKISQKLRMIREASFTSTLATIRPPSELRRLKILLRRNVLIMSRNWTIVYLKPIFTFLVAILLGLLFEQSGEDASKTISNFGYVTISGIYTLYTSLIPAVLTFPLELVILRKERFNNWYHLRTYYVATLVTTLPIHIFLSVLYSSITYVLTSQPMEWPRFFKFLLILILTTSTSESLGLALGTICNPVNGTFFGSILACAMLCLAGYLVLLSHMPVFLYYVSYLNYFRYTVDGLFQSIYGFHREKLYCPSHITYCHYRIPSMILKELSMSRSMFWFDVVILLGWFVALRIIVYFTLRRKLSKI